MTFRIDFDRPTYDRTSRTLFQNLELAIKESGGIATQPLLADLRKFAEGRAEGRFVDMEENEDLDLKEEVWTDLRALGVVQEELDNDMFMKIDDLLDAALADGFGSQMAISDIAQSVYQRSLEA